jgi:solute carrier family 35 protein E1
MPGIVGSETAVESSAAWESGREIGQGMKVHTVQRTPPQQGPTPRISLFGTSSRNGFKPKRRSSSFSETGQEAFRQLAPPVSVPLVVLCLSWYLSSAVANTLAKSILDSFPYPVTLSMAQFGMAVCFGVCTIQLAKTSPTISKSLPRGFLSSGGIRLPTREILMETAPMGIFQLSGHIFSHMSTQAIPVSLVHTIKALSPLFTVAAYRVIFHVTYSRSVYLSLIPLTVGVIMTCSAEFSSHLSGLIYALVATMIFVTQNMFSKRLLSSSSSTDRNSFNGDPHHNSKLDKMNVLCYCSSLAFIFTFPLWFCTEALIFMGLKSNKAGSDFNTSTLVLAIIANCFVHFTQNILAFQVLGMVSPVTYSVASLIKRIVVITVAILWFGQQVSSTQGWGIILTFAGLYLYDRSGGDKHKQQKTGPVLPK